MLAAKKALCRISTGTFCHSAEVKLRLITLRPLNELTAFLNAFGFDMGSAAMNRQNVMARLSTAKIKKGP
jgi:hypothetical protein